MSARLPTPDELDASPVESQWSIVARMFRKRRTAVWGMRGTVVLVLLAIYAPVLSSGLPFVWREPGGSVEYPWFSRMFDSNYWLNGVDRFFNLLLIAVTLWGLLRLVLWATTRLAPFARRPAQANRRRLRKIRIAFAGLTLLVAALPLLGIDLLATSNPYVDFRADAKRYAAVEEHLTQYRAHAAAGRTQDAAVAWKAAVDGDGRLQKWRDDDPAYDGSTYTHTAAFALIPYGHREQLVEPKDRYRGILDFEDGETHLLGTDTVGRDVFARLLYGTRISLTVGLVAVAFYVTIGTILGAVAGFAGGLVDLSIMRLIEIILCVPGLFLILTIIALFGDRSIFMIMLAIGLVGWTGIARLVRGEFIRERARDYVVAARSLGLSSARILFRHILPNAISPVIVSATFGVAGAIITESTLSFLGLGDASVPSWGVVLNDGRVDNEWHMILAPGVAIFITVTLLNLMGDGLRDALDPKLRR